MHLSLASTRLTLSAALCAAVLSLPARAETHVSVSLQLGAPAPIVVHEAPPRPVREVIVTSPGRGYVWVPGRYVWHHHHWNWVPGVWVVPPQQGAIYVEGRWDERSRNWVEAHWELPPPPPPPAPGYIVMAPPPPRQEVVFAQPSPHHVWISGYWVWRGHRHEWVAGHWELPPHGHQVWVAPRWEHRSNGYVFIEGCWR
jgi:hypothetical protein